MLLWLLYTTLSLTLYHTLRLSCFEAVYEKVYNLINSTFPINLWSQLLLCQNDPFESVCEEAKSNYGKPCSNFYFKIIMPFDDLI